LETGKRKSGKQSFLRGTQDGERIWWGQKWMKERKRLGIYKEGESKMRDQVIEQILEHKIIAIVRGVEGEKVGKIAKALYEGGIRLMEITFNQREPDSFVETAEAIRAVKAEMEGRMTVGAGTVISTALVELAHEAGADFVKLFPCDQNTPAYLKALRAPLSHIRFLAVGGVTAENAAAFLRAGALGVGIGGSLVRKEWVETGAFEEIRREARRLTECAGEGLSGYVPSHALCGPVYRK
jgi:2-dehydro-3-deoxyphosphogluconate aldolase/(4S)-4-hydroxy-2-oxoglutarate aldolase